MEPKDMIVNIGDKVMCKKDVAVLGVLSHNKGKFYSVFFVDEYNIRVYNNHDNDGSIFSKVGFANYFYTVKEVRKFKLEQINGER